MATLDRPTHLSWASKVFRRTLTRLGYSSKRQDGTEWEVSICDAVYYVPRDAGLLEIDVHRLPRRVKVADLASEDVCHELSAAIGGYKVESRNRRGLVYVVWYTEPEKATEAELPQRVDLDLSDRPRGQWLVPLGAGVDGARWVSLLDVLNVLIGGEPGAGKSMMLNTWLASLTQAHTPDELQLTLVDPKRVELAGWRNLPHLAGDIATTAEEAEAAIDLLLDDLDRRARLMQSVGARNLAGYNELSDRPLPLHLVIIDELTDLTLAAGGPRLDLFKKLIHCASTGRALGVLFVLATQSPRAEIVNSNLKAAMNTRIAFRTASRTDSRVILDRPDAASISRRTPGRCVAVLGDGLERLQGYHVTDDVLASLQGAHSASEDHGDGLLSEKERWVLNIARYDLAGVFAVDAIYDRTGPKSEGGVSYRWLKETAKKWEARGWLASDPANPTSPRVLTDVLRDVLTEAGSNMSEHTSERL